MRALWRSRFDRRLLTPVGTRQGSCRRGRAANAVMCVDLDAVLTTESFPGFSVTVPIGVQLRVWREQRARLRSGARRYAA